MHSATVAATSLAIAALSISGVCSSTTASLVLLTVGVSLLGVPHGALDPVTGKKLFGHLGSAWWVTFFAGYLALSSIVVFGWYVLPAFTCLLFFLFSAWHFGLEEDYSAPVDSSVLKQLLAVARGSLIILAISLFKPADVQAILNSVMPTDGHVQVETVMTWVQLSAFILLPVAVVDFASWYRSAGTGRSWTLLRIVSLGVLAWAANPLLTFGVYFCGWHSVRGLATLRAEVGGTFRELARRLAPLTALTLLFGFIAFVFWSWSEAITNSMLRTVFLGLSSIAIPHLALHSSYRFVTGLDPKGSDLQGALT